MGFFPLFSITSIPLPNLINKKKIIKNNFIEIVKFLVEENNELQCLAL